MPATDKRRIDIVAFPQTPRIGIDDRQRAQAFLESNRLRHLVHLKYLYLYDHDLDTFYSEQGAEVGVLLSHPIRLLAWDQGLYPDVDRVYLPVASGQVAAQALVSHALSHFNGSSKWLFKFCDSLTRDVFARSFSLQYARTLISFTTGKFQASESEWAQVVVSDQPDESRIALYRKNRYTQAEVEHYFADGARSFTIYEQGQAVCSCLAYRNFDTVWEIGALHTLESARRKGYARQVVSAALAQVLADGRIPRYVAETDNTASIRLAESLGMQPCLHLEHYLTSAAVNKHRSHQDVS